jgi:hypothetical protein
VAADLVLDMTGRRSALPRWLQGLGAPPLHEETADAGFTYYTRFFRSRGGGLPEVRDRVNVAYGTFSILTLPGDGGTWSVTLFASSRDRPLKELRHEAVWTSVVAACPTQAHWLDGKPITGVLPMGGVLNRYRRLVVDGAPVITGLLPVADAWASTNPSVGRGITLGLLHAVCLRDVLRAAPDEPRRQLAAWDAATEASLTPWYRATVATDEARLAEMDALRAGREPPRPEGPGALGATFARAMAFDAELFRGFMEVVGCLALPGEVLSRPGFADRVRRVAAEHPPSPRPGLDRGRLLRLALGTPVR